MNGSRAVRARQASTTPPSKDVRVHQPRRERLVRPFFQMEPRCTSRYAAFSHALQAMMRVRGSLTHAPCRLPLRRPPRRAHRAPRQPPLRQPRRGARRWSMCYLTAPPPPPFAQSHALQPSFSRPCPAAPHACVRTFMLRAAATLLPRALFLPPRVHIHAWSLLLAPNRMQTKKVKGQKGGLPAHPLRTYPPGCGDDAPVGPERGCARLALAPLPAAGRG
jgi:hypothetical protein